MAEWLQWIADSAIATSLRRSTVLYPLLSAAHITSLGVLIGTIMTLDLRMLGALRRSSLAELAQLMPKLAAAGLLSAVLTGALLFSVQPGHYATNTAFQIKLVLLALGLLNVFLVHRLEDWRLVTQGHSPSVRVRLSASCSLLLWLAVIIAGRWVAFV